MARGIEMISMAKRKGPLAPVVVRFVVARVLTFSHKVL